MQETSAAFVTLRSRLTQSVCTTGMLSYDEDLWQTHPAPTPGDIIWKHVPYRGWERTLRQVLLWGAFILLLFIYMPIVLAVQSVINLEAYRSKVKAVGTLLDLPVIGGARHWFNPLIYQSYLTGKGSSVRLNLLVLHSAANNEG
jgi:hypothetical protein